MSRINFNGTTGTIIAKFSVGTIEARSLEYLQTLGGEMAYPELYASKSHLPKWRQNTFFLGKSKIK